MKNLFSFTVFLLCFLCSNLLAYQSNFSFSEINLKTSDNINVRGYLFDNKAGKSAATILMFHQGGGDALGEYLPIVNPLLAKGYNILTIDQRRGGTRFGGINKTMAGLSKGVEYSYSDAYPDLEAALKYVKTNGYTGKIIAWGSSYSAALMFKFSAEHANEIDAALSFSPAIHSIMGESNPPPFFNKIKIPFLALRPLSEMDTQERKEQFKAMNENGIQTYVAENGVHGSSMLNDIRIKGSSEKTWKVVFDFLKKIGQQ